MDEGKVVITFETTTQAMAWERACKQEELPGRLIPVPVVISANCGLAWQIAPEELEVLLRRAEELSLSYEQVVELN